MKKQINQAIYQLRNQPLLSIITILGTALAVCLIMVILIVYQAKTADNVPEVNRSRSLYVKWEQTIYGKDGKNGRGHSCLSLWLVKELFADMETPEAVTAIYRDGGVQVNVAGSDEMARATLTLTDDAFWKVYQFSFLAGKPFDDAEFQSGIKKVVLVESVARRLFGDVNEAIGKAVLINFAEYTVCGVVEDVNRFCEHSYAEAYVPYTSNAVASQLQATVTSGNYIVAILARSTDDFPAIREELGKQLDKLNSSLYAMRQNDEWMQEVNLMGQPDDFRTQLNRKYANQYENLNDVYWEYGIVIAIILLVPAVNLSGLTNTRMRRHLEELGIKKAFGATKTSLVWQVLNENLFLTILGGVVGLLLAYLAIWLMDDWLLLTSYGEDVATMTVAMISPIIFFIAFGICLLLNLLSAYLPAWRVAHAPIVYSLNQKL